MNNPDLLSVASDLAGYGDDKELAAAGRAYVLSELRGATRAAPGPTCAEALLRLTVGVSTHRGWLPSSRVDPFTDSDERAGDASVREARLLLDHLRAAGFKCPACKGEGICESLVNGDKRERKSHGLNPSSEGSGKSVAKADTSATGAFSTKAKRKAKD